MQRRGHRTNPAPAGSPIGARVRAHFKAIEQHALTESQKHALRDLAETLAPLESYTHQMYGVEIPADLYDQRYGPAWEYAERQAANHHNDCARRAQHEAGGEEFALLSTEAQTTEAYRWLVSQVVRMMRRVTPLPTADDLRALRILIARFDAARVAQLDAQAKHTKRRVKMAGAKKG